MCNLEIIIILDVSQGIPDDLTAFQGVALNLFELVIVQSPRFIQDDIGYLDLANVMFISITLN